MTVDGERIAKLESRLDHVTEALDDIRAMLKAALEKQAMAEQRIEAYENQLKGARYIFSVFAAIAAFLGFNKFGYLWGGK